jgi:potassium-transporting ATPase potassium-binding subunit
MWLLPISIVVFTIIIAVPLSRYMAKIMDGKYRAPGVLRWFEKSLDSGPQNWKQYTVALLAFNIVLFVYGYIVLSLQPRMPLNPRGLGMLAPTTVFHTVISFITNTNMQHYSGDVAFSNFSQIFFCIANFFLSASVGLCALAAIIRALRGDLALGNFFVDMWRVVVYMFLPAAFVISLVFLAQGMPMTYQNDYQVSTLEPAAMGTADNGQPKQQTIVIGPLAAFVPMKMMGTNGGGFFGMNSAHPFENPSAGYELLRNFLHDAVSDGAGADVRPDARAVSPRDGHILGDAAVVDRHCRVGDLLRHAQTEPGSDRSSAEPNFRDRECYRARR